MCIFWVEGLFVTYEGLFVPVGDVNDKGRPLSGQSDEDAPIVDKLLGKIRQGNFTDSPDFHVTKVEPVRLDGEMPAIANGTTNDSAADASSPFLSGMKDNVPHHFARYI